jgi:acetyl-CoA carboxylase biotin carboxyl carrier protein
MAEKTLIARVHPDGVESGILLVNSPAVGVVDFLPPARVFLNRFDRVGVIRILGERYAIRLPRDVQGRVSRVHLPEARTPVAYDAPLLVLDRNPDVSDIARAHEAGEDAASVSGTLKDSVITVSAPSEGIFYRRPAPDAPAFVEVGSRVSTGSVLGMVEVMKCFNQIAYGGPGLPERGEVVRVLLDDSTEVAFGQPLFLVRPLDP